MSGICAIWTLKPDWRDISRQLQAGLDAMAHRGRDGFSIYFDDRMGVGHCLFDTGCNGMFVDNDGFAISFDGRIDNREALIGHLSAAGILTALETERMQDKALLLTLYRQFGGDFLPRLRGDFAVIILDPQRRSMFAFRDHFGVRPLYWHRTEDAIYLASEIKALRAMSGETDFPVGYEAATEFIEGKLGKAALQCTFLEGVFRLLPAHWARLDDQGMAIQRYWQLSVGLPVRRPDAPAQLRALLEQAINRRLRATKPIGALLSGGMDSSSIVSLLGSGRLRGSLKQIPVFSLVFDGDADETQYIEAMEQQHAFRAKRIDGSSIAALDDCDAIVEEQDQPIPAPNIATFRHFMRRIVGESGVQILIDGHGGDETLSYGNGIFHELAERGSWLRLWQELGRCDELKRVRWATWYRLVRTRGLLHWRRLAGRLLRGRRRTDDLVRYTSDGIARPYEQAYHLSKLTSPLFERAAEGIDLNAASAGIEVRMPFLDVDLIEFCATLPADAKWVNGTSRAVLRKALADVLPPLIATRRDKFDFTDRVRRSLLARNATLVNQALYDAGEMLVRYADIARLRSNWQTFRESGTIDGERYQELWRSVMLQRWLLVRSRRAGPEASARVPDYREIPAE